MILTSSAFGEGAIIPEKFSCKGRDVSPPLSWAEVPAGVISFALICDDPDAPGGTWDHWLYYDIPGETRELNEAVPKDEGPAPGGEQGHNSWRQSGYRGPCPPGGTHRYVFKLFALDILLGLGPGANKNALFGAMKGHILEQTQLMGRFSR